MLKQVKAAHFVPILNCFELSNEAWSLQKFFKAMFRKNTCGLP